MNVSGFRPGPFARPILIAAAIVMAGAGAAQAACADAIKAFEKAVAERQVDAAVSGLNDISDSPSQMCLGRLAEFRAKLVAFLIDYARTPDLDTGVRDNAIDKAEKVIATCENWQLKAQIGDYHFAHGDKPKAFLWYQLSIGALSTPGFTATDEERRALMQKLAAAQSLVNDDNGGGQR
jgi:hypothetical protein